MIPADKIAEVLGFQKSIHSLPELARRVVEGLPKSALRRCVERVVKDRQTQRSLIYRIVPEATYKRRRDLLKLEESEHTERLARVIATAEYVWDNEEESRRFLTTSNPALEGLRPIDAAYTELGARQVEELLWQIFYGLPL
jgi:putative toxin-antitoxin system antitoxin component (TIGR02293 family)